MRLSTIISIAILTASMVYGSGVDTKIKKSKKSLMSTQKEHRYINAQLIKIATSIRQRREELAKMEKILDDLALEQSKSQAKYDAVKMKLDNFENEISKIDYVIKQKEQDFDKLLKEQFAMVMAMKELNITNQKAVIIKEFYETSKKLNEEELANLKDIIKKSGAKKAKLQKEYIALKLSIVNLETKRRLYQNKRVKLQNILAKLKKEEKLYQKKLLSIMDKRSQLRKTLARLNIIKKEELARLERLEKIKRAQLAKRAKAMDALRKKTARARRKARARGEKVSYKAVDLKVKHKKVSRHQKVVSNYRGGKTISPIRNASIARRFGTYIDPIYKIKFFNDALILKAPKKGAKVRAILNGKVIYVGENPMLGKVVIIQHSNHLHTTYSGLAGISPLIKSGKVVRKGTPIGIVKRKLIFRATQNSKFIDPLKLIKL
jgi:murein DD-endopeptidase MepM/ murein hydrolase activator NlpD